VGGSRRSKLLHRAAQDTNHTNGHACCDGGGEGLAPGKPARPSGGRDAGYFVLFDSSEAHGSIESTAPALWHYLGVKNS
jgi:hypothetical protein